MPWGNMATNTSNIVYPHDSDDRDYQSEVQNVAQQVIPFVDNSVQSSDNESLNNDTSGNKSVDSENCQNGNGNCVQIPISNYEWDTEHETDFEMGWGWIIESDPGLSVTPFLGDKMLLMDPEKNEPQHFFEALFEAEMWNHIVDETNKCAEARITQRCK